MNPRLVLGTVFGHDDQLLDISTPDLLHHTLVVGQSGSGKSFMLARLMEEILLRTRARIVVVDPNGDFRLLSEVAKHEHFHGSLRPRFDTLKGICEKAGNPVFDEYDAFRDAWDTRFFQYITANPASTYTPPELYQDRVRHSALFVHWEHLHEEQEFLIDTLEVAPRGKAKLNMAMRACNAVLGEQVNSRFLPQGYGLLEVIATAQRFLNRDIGLGGFEYVKDLTAEDWWIAYAYLQQLYRRYEWLWWHHPAQYVEDGQLVGRTRKRDMLGHLMRPFGRFKQWDEWNACMLTLDRVAPDDALLAVNFALFRLWRSAQHQWRIALQGGQEDTRVPTFVILDEAHNFAPHEPRNTVQKRVTDKLIQIAAEGRKYGLYLILATQRPRKLHPSLVLECENACILRVQSRAEQDFAAKEFAIPDDMLKRAGTFGKGHSLLSGRWMQGRHVEATIAPARTIVGGGGVPNLWVVPPVLQKRVRPDTTEAVGDDDLEVGEQELSEVLVVKAEPPIVKSPEAITRPVITLAKSPVVGDAAVRPGSGEDTGKPQ